MSRAKILTNDIFNTCKLHFKNGEIIEVDLSIFEDKSAIDIIFELCGGNDGVQSNNFDKVAHIITVQGTYFIYRTEEVIGLEFDFDPDSDLCFYWGYENDR